MIVAVTYLVAAIINIKLFLCVSLSSAIIMGVWAKYDSIKYPCGEAEWKQEN